MVFSSHIFLFYFLPLALGLYYALWRAPQRWRNVTLILTGYAFYGWAEPMFMPLMFFTTFVDWLVSLMIAHNEWRVWRVWSRPVPLLEHGGTRSQTQRSAITISIILNLAVLGFFKYFNFGVESYNALAQSMGLESWQWNTFFEVVLPLGISFYTFQAMSYTIDVYRGEARAMASLADFSCFVSMFPHLVAGPILKFSFLADQIESRSLTMEKFARGVAFLSLVHHRFLAALAHLAVELASRLPLHSPWRQQAGSDPHLHQSSSGHAHRRALARGLLEFCDLGRDSWHGIGIGALLSKQRGLPLDSSLPSNSLHLFYRGFRLGFLSCERLALRSRLLFQHGGMGGVFRWGGIAGWDHLPALLPWQLPPCRIGGVDGTTDLGLDSGTHLRKSRRARRSILAFDYCDDHAGLQSLHLFYLLGSDDAKN